MSAFSGIRILDFTQGIAGPMATMLLADFEADVLKVEPPGGDRMAAHPGYLCWNRNKRRVSLDLKTYEGRHAARALVSRADVAVFDAYPGELEGLGLDAGTLTAANPGLLHVWMPPFGERGRWSQLPREEPLFAAVAGGSWFQFSWEGVPVHLVTPQTSYGHALTGAAAMAAALAERAGSGVGQSLVVSGLHGFAAIESGGAMKAGEILRMRGRGARGGVPNYRLYQCAGGEWLFLGTLIPGHFLKALEALDLLDILLMEGVDGEFTNVLQPAISPAVIERLDARFAEKPREEWLRILHEHGVPRGPVTSRDDWFHGETATANEMRVTLQHPSLGPVEMPGVPAKLRSTPGSVRRLLADTSLDAVLAEWQPRPETVPAPAADPPGGPLAGVRVLDLGVIIAGPHATTVLANFGADVIKVEPLEGDSFRPYGLGFVGFNQGKRSVAIDFKHPGGREAFFDLVRGADVVCDNYRLGVLDRLGIDYATLSAINPRIIQCSVTGYGPTGPLAPDPGFDPIMQARSGLMMAQGGDDEPVFHQIPVNDTASAIMAAFAISAALHARERTGKGQRVETCLANQSIICQSGELTLYEGRPPAPLGGRDCPGEAALRRLFQCQDGWIVIWASRPEDFQQLCLALGHPEWVGRLTAEQALQQPAESQLTTQVAEALAPMTRDEAIDRLHARGVPAAPATTIEEMFTSPWHRANRFFLETEHPMFGPMTTVNSYGEFSRTPGGFRYRAPLLAEHTDEVFSEFGFDPARIAALEEAGGIGRFQPPA
jgi:crotonobetainyl-CoA:carnitine CoA-transferase CaiB-like acyl-CoA transferase